MKRFRILFSVLCLVLVVPIGLLIHQALESVAFERDVRHEAIAERVFDEMERVLSRVLEREEGRPFGHYRFYYAPEGKVGGAVTVARSPLARPPSEPFVLGHFQIDPDGSFHTPLRPRNEAFARSTGDWSPTSELLGRIAAIEQLVVGRWRRDQETREENASFELAKQPPGTTLTLEEQRSVPQDKRKASAYDALRSLNRGVKQRSRRRLQVKEEYSDLVQSEALALQAREGAGFADEDAAFMAQAPRARRDATPAPERLGRASAGSAKPTPGLVRVELTPMVGQVIDAQHMILYRTVLLESEGFRQGLVVQVENLATRVREQALGGDGLASVAELQFSSPYFGTRPPRNSEFVYLHRFAEPFDDLGAQLALPPLPGVGGGAYVYSLCAALLLMGAIGLTALYRMVAVVVSFAERRSNFVAAVSHELKTPLTAIRMYGEMLRDGLVPSEEKRQDYYETITVESERLSRLINNVLEFSRLEKGTRELSLVTGSPAPVLEEAAKLLRPHVEREGFTLHVEADGDLPPIRFDRDALLQVVFNLVDNALKYARHAERREVTLRCSRQGEGVAICVRDSGPGVLSRHLARVFEPFYRGERELTRRTKGTGLGLALVRALVEQMGGRVSGRNLDPVGFEVRVSFDPSPED